MALALTRDILSQLDLDTVLERVLEAARDLTGSRYAALGVLDASRSELSRFLTRGIDEETRTQIGPLPRGHGVLGELIRNPVPLRLGDVGSHPRSYGFPPGHPPMQSFLGVPILIRGEAYGNLYLTERSGGYSEQDESTVVMLAEFAAIAIDNARRFTGSEDRRDELERTVAALRATTEIARALGGETDLDALLGLAAKRVRAVVEARTLAIGLVDRDRLHYVAGAGEDADRIVGQSVPLEDNLSTVVLRSGKSEQISDELNRARFERGLGGLGVEAETGVYVPLTHRGRPLGVLVALDVLTGVKVFGPRDEELLEACAVAVATAAATAKSFTSERRSQRLAAAEDERRRWARELHDETLQSLAALRFALDQASSLAEGEPVSETLAQAMEQLDLDIDNLRAIITDLRPAALDELGAAAAVESLVARARARHGVDIGLHMDLAWEHGREPTRNDPDLETAVYRITQEAITNATHHGEPHSIEIDIREDAAKIVLSVHDDGRGFDTTRPGGFGLTGMQERAELLGGELQVESAPGEGTTVTAVLPVRRREPQPAADTAVVKEG